MQREPMEVIISKVESQEDFAKINTLYHEFHEDVPLTAIFNLEGHQRHVEPKYRPEDFLIIAKDAKGNIVGFAANKVNAVVTKDPDPSPERVELEKFLEFIENNAQLDKLLQRCIELRVIVVTDKWRGKGLGRRLVEESMSAARAAGFSTMKMFCVSEFTARLASNLGWKEHYRLAIHDYPRLSGRNVQLKLNPPHDQVYCYYTEL